MYKQRSWQSHANRQHFHNSLRFESGPLRFKTLTLCMLPVVVDVLTLLVGCDHFLQHKELFRNLQALRLNGLDKSIMYLNNVIFTRYASPASRPQTSKRHHLKQKESDRYGSGTRRETAAIFAFFIPDSVLTLPSNLFDLNGDLFRNRSCMTGQQRPCAFSPTHPVSASSLALNISNVLWGHERPFHGHRSFTQFLHRTIGSLHSTIIASSATRWTCFAHLPRLQHLVAQQ